MVSILILTKYNGQVSGLYQCDICNKRFSRKYGLKSHISRVHEKNKLYKCPICEKNFSDNSYLKTHSASVHEGKRPYQCPICKATFTQRPHMNTHMKSFHNGSRTLKNSASNDCKPCFISFSKKVSYSENIVVFM